MDINDKGDLAFAKVFAIAIERGIAVSKPLSDSRRYDAILDNGTLLRAQIKYAGDCKSPGVARASLTKTYYKDGKARYLFYTAKDIDVILVYIAAIDKVCIFGPEFFENKGNIYIRYRPAKNNQAKNCLFADKHFW